MNCCECAPSYQVHGTPYKHTIHSIYEVFIYNMYEDYINYTVLDERPTGAKKHGNFQHTAAVFSFFMITCGVWGGKMKRGEQLNSCCCAYHSELMQRQVDFLRVFQFAAWHVDCWVRQSSWDARMVRSSPPEYELSGTCTE